MGQPAAAHREAAPVLLSSFTGYVNGPINEQAFGVRFPAGANGAVRPEVPMGKGKLEIPASISHYLTSCAQWLSGTIRSGVPLLQHNLPDRGRRILKELVESPSELVGRYAYNRVGGSRSHVSRARGGTGEVLQ